MTAHKEIAFEEEICEHLGSHGWIYVEGDASKYDRARALFPDDVLAWVQTTQPDAWAALVKVTGEGGSKSGELAEALSGDKKIVVCTIQTFPFALKFRLP
jgi:type I site-specific restriction-modification system R (restriction) subunit